MKRAAVGFRVHSGWAAMIAVSLAKNVPELLVRRRVHLVKTFSYEYRQPYHTAAKSALDEGRAFVSYVKSEARALALRALREVKIELEKHDYSLERCGLLLASSMPLPALPKILASHALIHTADGELFREALFRASTRCGLEPLAIKERDLLDSAARALRRRPADLAQHISGLGRSLGPPWSKDEKLASLVAWLAASSRSSLPLKAR
jgi:hypothetical protein